MLDRHHVHSKFQVLYMFLPIFSIHIHLCTVRELFNIFSKSSQMPNACIFSQT